MAGQTRDWRPCVELSTPVQSAITWVGGGSQDDVGWSMGSMLKKHTRAYLVSRGGRGAAGYILACELGPQYGPVGPPVGMDWDWGKSELETSKVGV